MKNPYALVSFAGLFALVVGCAGGGTGGGTTGGSGGGTTGGDYPSTSVPAGQTRYQGQLLEDGRVTPISGARVRFYNSSGVTVGSTMTTAQGKFWLEVDPTTVSSFFVDKTSINTTYAFYPYFLYKGDTYDMNNTNCHAKVPTATLGAVTWITSFSVPVRSDPPPSPPVCK